MKQWITNVAARFFAPATTVTEDITNILGAFTAIAEKLQAAIQKGYTEISNSFDREDAAYQTFTEIKTAEFHHRVAVRAALNRAHTANHNITALIGEDA